MKLTIRQLKVLRLYNQGYTRKQAAETLCLSENTIAWYLRQIRTRYDVKSRREMLALEHKLLGQISLCE